MWGRENLRGEGVKSLSPWQEQSWAGSSSGGWEVSQELFHGIHPPTGAREVRRAALLAELLQGEGLGCSSELGHSLARGSGSSWSREMKCVKQGNGSSSAPLGAGAGLVIFLGSEIPVWEEEISKGRFSFPRAGAGTGFSDSLERRATVKCLNSFLVIFLL